QAAYKFLTSLLNLPNVIITSRPHAIRWPRLEDPDLELETIGFYPDQVKDYLEKTVRDRQKVAEIRSFLQRNQLVQGLVRIPIQLDALSFTWGDGDSSFHIGPGPETMTAVYQAIEQRLWKKDAVKLGRAQPQMQFACPRDVSRFVKNENSLLEIL